MKHNHFSMLPEKAFQPRNGRFGMTLEGGDSPAPAPTQTSQISIPEYAKPYVERMIGKAEALTSAPYQAYQGERFAGPTAAQQEARADVAGMQTQGGYATGANYLQQAAQQGLAAGQYSPEQVAARQLQQYQMTKPSDVTAERATSSMFGSPEAQQYMSPYMQNVLDVQKEMALRDAQKAQLAQNLGAARQGTYGGSRQLIAMTERERNLGDTMARIQAEGQQRAFENAQQQFERDQARRMAAQQLNVQSGLQAALANQQAGLTTEQQNLAAKLGVQQLGSQQALQAALANQAAGLSAEQLGLQGAQMATQAGLGLGQLSTQQQQAALQLAQAQEQFGQLSQADQQKILSQKYEDYITQQQNPYKQLGFMSDILRGSANLAGTGGKTVYEAPPSMMSQLVGPGLLGYGLYREMNK